MGPLACPFDGRQLIAGVIDSAWRSVDLAEVVDGKAAGACSARSIRTPSPAGLISLSSYGSRVASLRLSASTAPSWAFVHMRWASRTTSRGGGLRRLADGSQYSAPTHMARCRGPGPVPADRLSGMLGSVDRRSAWRRRTAVWLSARWLLSLLAQRGARREDRHGSFSARRALGSGSRGFLVRRVGGRGRRCQRSQTM